MKRADCIVFGYGVYTVCKVDTDRKTKDKAGEN